MLDRTFLYNPLFLLILTYQKMDIKNTTRRSFIKKTTALGVGISAATLFSGLVHASGAASSYTGTGKSCHNGSIAQTSNQCVTDSSGYWTCTGPGGVTAQCGQYDPSNPGTPPNGTGNVWCPDGDC